LAWGAIASTGYFEPTEVAAMALPLLAALLVQACGWPTGRWQRALELLAVAVALGLLALRVGMLLLVVGMLFLLCGVRLCLPRGPAQRRQLLLMGFLLYLTTSVTTSQLDFLAWSLAWVAGAALVLLRQAWEPSAALRRGPPPPPPYGQVLRWGPWTLVLAAGLFVVLPRLPAAARRLPLGVRSLGGLRSGLSDVLDLGGAGPIQDNREVALRVQPVAPAGAAALAGGRRVLGLLRAYLLEGLEGRRWTTAPETPVPPGLRWAGGPGPAAVTADFFFGPGLLGTLPLPYGQVQLAVPAGEPLRAGPGGSLRWAYPVRRTTALRVAVDPEDLEPAPAPRGRRLALLTATGDASDRIRDWSLRAAPTPRPARDLARDLTDALRGQCSYTLDNPSGGAPDPLVDFLERSRAGHCEYFASALALMLRSRGVPARVATGYRLGAWNEQGGYFLVTQSEAHSWVEYYDPEAGGWRTADPSPAPPPAPFGTAPFAAAWGRWADVLRFQWDRRVVRFSDDDQVAGWDWAVQGLGALGRWRPGPGARTAAAAGAALALLAGAAWLAWRRRGGRPGAWPFPGPEGPERIRELDPLVRRARRLLPPDEAETARAWLDRLARLRPHRAGELRRLAREVDAVAYGGRSRQRLRDLARDEARRWKR
jgi:transglutaminase-like putative cysteine protease